MVSKEDFQDIYTYKETLKTIAECNGWSVRYAAGRWFLVEFTAWNTPNGRYKIPPGYFVGYDTELEAWQHATSLGLMNLF